jgi:prepilin-type N-terminal cleavage/methylation domain-containing protein
MSTRGGYTLVELMISLGVFTVLMLSIFGFIQTGTAVYFQDSTLLELQQKARNGMDRMVREIRQSKASSVTVIDANSDMIIFSTPTKANIAIYRQGTNLVREYPSGSTPNVLATNITYLKFTKTGVQLVLNIRAEKTAYQRTFSFPLHENIKLRNE